MHDVSTPTIFQNAPAFSTEPTAEARWDKIAWKLNTFHQAGGQFRDQTVLEFQASNGYPATVKDWQENCFSTALGIFVKGDHHLEPGALHLLKQNKKDKTWRATNDGSLPYYTGILSKPALFENLLQTGLAEDGIVKDTSDIQNYFPVIGISYKFNEHQSDYHFIVPHVQEGQDNPVFHFSHRLQLQGHLRDYRNEQELLTSRYLNDDCNHADVYLVPKAYLGRHVVVEKPTYHPVSKQSARHQRAYS